MTDFINNINKISPSGVKYTEIENEGKGLVTFVVHIDLGIPFTSARSCICTAYVSTIKNDEYLTVTTKGCEHLVEKHMDKIGVDSIIPDCELNWYRLAPIYTEGKITGT